MEERIDKEHDEERKKEDAEAAARRARLAINDVDVRAGDGRSENRKNKLEEMRKATLGMKERVSCIGFALLVQWCLF